MKTKKIIAEVLVEIEYLNDESLESAYNEIKRELIIDQIIKSSGGFRIKTDKVITIKDFKEYKIDIDNKDYYNHFKPETNNRTRERLIQIAESGMSEVGYGQFGVNGIMSGLYIEKVWNYSDEDFKSYMDWAIELITRKSKF